MKRIVAALLLVACVIWVAISGVLNDVFDWASKTASDVADWTSQAAAVAWNWTSETAKGAWIGITNFFDAPSTEGVPTIAKEPELPEGTLKMYLGYAAQKTNLNSGYSGTEAIDKDDPHFGLAIGKFYISGFSQAISNDNEHFIFLKTVGDNVELHFELAQDIDMLGGDTFVTVNANEKGYDQQFGIPQTDFGRGTLIVRHTDYQNNPGEPQVYTDYLTAKTAGTTDTVISLNEEGDYEVALDYQIKKQSYVIGSATSTKYSDYKITFKFSVRNGNCMIFPRDAVTGSELKNTSVAENGFYLDLANSRYLKINVKLSTLTEGAGGVVEDIRFNRPAKDGEQYTREGIYTISVANPYTGEQTTKQIYVGTDERLMEYVSNGYSVEKVVEMLSGE